ncbi:MAG TPA: hypothetical protein VJ689_02705 [Gaiellaceae bacterium]|nr:hypothetical protein [Gaiellaceae bacterium]
MTIGAVLGEAWSLYTRFFARFLVIALIVFAVVNVVYALLDAALYDDDDLSSATSWILVAISVAASTIGTFWLQGAFVKAVQDVRDGTFDSTTSEIFGAVTPVLGTLIVAGILAGLGIGIGFILLIVPGVILLTWWAVIAPVIVVEHKGVIDSFGRSRELVSGFFWPVLGIVLITALLTGVAGGILTAVFSFLPRFLEILIGATVAQAIVAPFSAIALTLTYFKLREAKEAAATPTAPEPTGL